MIETCRELSIPLENGETRRESKDKNPSGKPSLFQQVVLDARNCYEESTHKMGVLAERQPSPARDEFQSAF
jgi:hypothetical protein